MRDPITLAWTVLAAFGVLLQSLLLVDSVITLRVARNARDYAALSVARSHIRSGAVYLLVHAIFLLVGLAVIFVWQLGTVLGWSFIAAAALLIFAGAADYVQRVLFRRQS